MRTTRRTFISFVLTAVITLFVGFPAGSARAQTDPLASWNDGAAKTAIATFVTKVTKAGSPDFVPPAERIATFDNDGTLWAEQPMPVQLFFALDRVKALAPQHPEWKTTEPFASLLKGDVKAALAGGDKAILQIFAVTHTGMSTDEFEKIVTDWIATAKHPKTGRLFTEMVYQADDRTARLSACEWVKTFIVSGGGIEFMRPWMEKVFGIPPEQVVGSSGKLKFEMRDGNPVLLKLAEVDLIDDGEGKPVGIQTHIGRRPIAAFGNSDGDLQMLQWTAAGNGARFCLYVHHTDAKREWAYDRTSSIGKLDKGLDEAAAKGWTVVGMKDDWKTIFPPQAVTHGFQTLVPSTFPHGRTAYPLSKSQLRLDAGEVTYFDVTGNSTPDSMPLGALIAPAGLRRLPAEKHAYAPTAVVVNHKNRDEITTEQRIYNPEPAYRCTCNYVRILRHLMVQYSTPSDSICIGWRWGLQDLRHIEY